MSRKSFLPKFPDSYIGEEAIEYDHSKWMERNQKKTTNSAIKYLFDNHLDNIPPNYVLENRSYLILDLGCGTGFSSDQLLNHGYRVIGIDILPDMLQKAKNKKKLNGEKRYLDLILADINYLPIKSESIDHILSISAYNFIIHGKVSQRDKTKTANHTAKYLRTILKSKSRIIIEFYPQDEEELNFFIASFTSNGFNGFMIKKDPHQKAGQTFLLLKKQ